MKEYFVYILTNKSNNVLYIGVTSDIEKRIWEHKNHITKGFSSKYNTEKLVYLEQTNDIYTAIAREKQLKNWHRQWKINLITQANPEWKDLSDNFFDTSN